MTSCSTLKSPQRLAHDQRMVSGRWPDPIGLHSGGYTTRGRTYGPLGMAHLTFATLQLKVKRILVARLRALLSAYQQVLVHSRLARKQKALLSSLQLGQLCTQWNPQWIRFLRLAYGQLRKDLTQLAQWPNPSAILLTSWRSWLFQRFEKNSHPMALDRGWLSLLRVWQLASWVLRSGISLRTNADQLKVLLCRWWVRTWSYGAAHSQRTEDSMIQDRAYEAAIGKIQEKGAKTVYSISIPPVSELRILEQSTSSIIISMLMNMRLRRWLRMTRSRSWLQGCDRSIPVRNGVFRRSQPGWHHRIQ